MDFKMDVEKFEYLINQYESLVDDIGDVINQFSQVMNDLSPGWDGASKEKFYKLAFAWIQECAELSDNIDNMNKILKPKNKRAEELLDVGVSLKV